MPKLLKNLCFTFLKGRSDLKLRTTIRMYIFTRLPISQLCYVLYSGNFLFELTSLRKLVKNLSHSSVNTKYKNTTIHPRGPTADIAGKSLETSKARNPASIRVTAILFTTRFPRAPHRDETS